MFVLSEYNNRCKLKELGFSDSLNNLDAMTGELFAIISDEVAKIQDEQRAKRSR